MFAAPDESALTTTFPSLRADLARRLNDTRHVVWSAAQLDGWINEGYREFCSRTRCLWKRAAYSSLSAGVGLYDTPVELVRLERATWDGRSLRIVESFDFSRHDPLYRTATGYVEMISSDGEGVRRFRLYRAPDSVGVHTQSDSFGLSRKLPFGASQAGYGVPRRIPGKSATAPYGIPRHMGDSNLKLEYSYKGGVVNGVLEIPDRYVRYVRDYAMWRALRAVGDGQDPPLAEHYKGRFEYGVRVTRNRVKDAQSQPRPRPQFRSWGPMARFGPEYSKRDIF